MTEVDEYWRLVSEARSVAGDRGGNVATHVVAALRGRTPDEVFAHHRVVRALMAASYAWPLWHAAYQINGGCSDDGFDYFRGWLLTQGREVFERAVADPDSLADVPAVRAAVADREELEDEDMMAATAVAYKQLTGGYPPRVEGVAYPALGPGWDFDDKTGFATRLPRLYALMAG